MALPGSWIPMNYDRIKKIDCKTWACLFEKKKKKDCHVNGCMLYDDDARQCKFCGIEKYKPCKISNGKQKGILVKRMHFTSYS